LLVGAVEVVFAVRHAAVSMKFETAWEAA
jgi:hypothetical protein